MNSAKAEVSTTTLNNVTSIPNLATIGTVTTGTWTSTDIGVAYGGTGASTLGSNLVLLGNGTSAIQSVTAGSNDQVLTLVAGVPAWQSGTLDKTLDYAWTGQHRWTTGTTTFNSPVSLIGYTSATSLQIASSSVPTPDKDTEVANKKYVDDNDSEYSSGAFSETNINNTTKYEQVTYSFDAVPDNFRLTVFYNNEVASNGYQTVGSYDGTNASYIGCGSSNGVGTACDSASGVSTQLGKIILSNSNGWIASFYITWMSATSTVVQSTTNLANDYTDFVYFWEAIRY